MNLDYSVFILLNVVKYVVYSSAAILFFGIAKDLLLSYLGK